MTWQQVLKVLANVVGAGAVGYASGGWPGAITTASAVLAGLFQNTPLSQSPDVL